MKISQTKLNNGLKLIHVKKESEAATVLFMVGVGSKFETKSKAGISHFLEHMFFKGTKTRPSSVQIAEYIEGIGGSFNAFTSKEFTGYYAEVSRSHLERAFNFVSDLIIRPLLPAEEIEKEKGVIVEEMNMYQDMPMQYVSEKFEELLYGDTPAGRLTIGTKEAVQSMKRPDFKNYLNKHYGILNGVLVVVGGDDLSKVKRMANKYFAELQKGQKPTRAAVKEKQSQQALMLLTKKTDQSHLCLGFRTVSLKSKERYAAAVLAGILGGGMSSRLFTEIREKRGLCYYIKASQNSYTDSGYFVVRAGIDNAKVEEAIKATLAEIRRIKDEDIPQKEIKKIKEFLKGKLALSLETTQDTAIYMAEKFVLENKIESVSEVQKKIDAVSEENIKRLLNKYFINEGLNLAVIGPTKSKAKLNKILKI
ncbi:insulinase family protein [Patescibacteria group bacterium]|nr:insulinase family protein [Patescibacteria group bacterium]